jgi:hypothetical protein
MMCNGDRSDHVFDFLRPQRWRVSDLDRVLDVRRDMPGRARAHYTTRNHRKRTKSRAEDKIPAQISSSPGHRMYSTVRVSVPFFPYIRCFLFY